MRSVGTARVCPNTLDLRFGPRERPRLLDANRPPLLPTAGMARETAGGVGGERATGGLSARVVT